MADEYEIRKGIPLPPSSKRTGLTCALRKMEYLDSIVIPGDKISSVHPCAGQAGAKVKTEKNADGTVTVWCIQPSVAIGPPRKTGRPRKHPAPATPKPAPATAAADPPHRCAGATAAGPGSAAVVTTAADPALGLPEGYYSQGDPYGPSIWMEGKPPGATVTATATSPTPAPALASTSATHSIFD